MMMTQTRRIDDLHPVLGKHRLAWEKNGAVRTVYADFYKKIKDQIDLGGVTVEIGSGAGHSTELLPVEYRTDILTSPWVDFVSNAHSLPLDANSCDSIVMVDVLHHLGDPKQFFLEAARVLRSRGRVVMVEPAITPISWFFYHFLHPEPVVTKVDPLKGDQSETKDPFDSNQAIPSLLFSPNFNEADLQSFLQFKVIKNDFLSLFAYPLSGGFSRPSLLGPRLSAPLLKLEDRILPYVGKYMAFRMFVVLEVEKL